MLAADQRNGKLICAGWPEALFDASECRLVRVASDAGRIEMLKNAVETGGTRGSWARADLQRSGIDVPPSRQGSLF